MATLRRLFVPTHPGRRSPTFGARHLHHDNAISDGQAGVAAFLLGHLQEKNTFPLVCGFMPYTAAQWAVTSTGTSAAQAQAATAGGGILLTTGSTSTFYSGLQSAAKVTPAAGKRYNFVCRAQVSHATQIGFNFGFGNTQADPTNTEYTDFVGFRKAPTSADVKGTIIGNGSGVPVQSSALLTVTAATEFELGMTFVLGATAAECSGSWWVNGTETQFASVTGALDEVVKLLTTAPTTFGLTLFCTGTSGNNPTCTITSCLAEVDN